MKHLIGLSLLLCPLGVLISDTFYSGQHDLFLALGFVIVGSLSSNRWVSWFSYQLAAWMLLALFLARMGVVSPGLAGSFKATSILVFTGIALFVAVSQSRVRDHIFYNWVCISVLVQCVVAVLQWAGADPVTWFLNLYVPSKSLVQVYGILGNPNFLGGYVAIGVPFFFRRGWAWGLPLLAFVLYISMTTSAVIPAIIGTCWFFLPWATNWGRGRMWAKGVLALVAVSTVLFASWYAVYSHTSIFANDRWQIWGRALMAWESNPFSILFGNGPGTSSERYPVHSEWVACLYQYGLVGISFLVGFVATIGKGDRFLFTSFMIACINMFGNYPLHLAPSAFLIILVAGLLERGRLPNA